MKGKLLGLVLALGGWFLPWPVQAQVISGSYTGNGGPIQAIAGLGFRPDVVIVKGNVLQPAVIRTSTIAWDNTKPLVGATALAAGGIRSLDSDGFTLGAHAAVNTNLSIYYWIAFKATAGESAVGSYAGTGATQSIAVGFQPDYIIVMSAGANAAVHSSSTMTAGESMQFDGTSAVTNVITAFQATGFQVGTDALANALGTTYHYVAWKAVTGKMKVGTYTAPIAGSVTGVGFRPEYVIIKRRSTTEGVHRPGSLGGNDTLNFTAAANTGAGRIISLDPDGFTVGTVAAVNSTLAYHWAAFGMQCGWLANPTYVAAAADKASGKPSVYWSSPYPVLILRKSGASITEVPANGAIYTVGTQPWGAAGPTVVYNGSVVEAKFTETAALGAGTYYYKVFPKGGPTRPCYATGVEANAAIASGTNPPAWSYMMTGGSILKPGIAGNGSINTSSNASRIVSLNTGDGTHRWDPIGTNAQIQGWLTWLPVGPAGVKSVQTGTTTMPVGTTAQPQTINVTLPTPLTDLTKSALFFNLQESSVNPGPGQVRGQILDVNTIQFNRAHDGSGYTDSAVTIQWYVVEFNGGVRVQRGTLSTTNNTNSTVTLTPVNLSKSFVLISCSVLTANVTYDTNDYFRARLLNSTTLEIVHSTVNSGDSMPCNWQVVEYAGASVQRGTGSLASGTASSGAIAISAVDTTKSFVQVTWRMTSAPATTQTGPGFLRAQLTGGGASVTIDRAATGTAVEYAWEVVSFTDGTIVQGGNLTFAAGDLSLKTPAFSNFGASGVDSTRAVAFLSAYQRGGSQGYTANDDVGPGWFTTELRDCIGNNCTTLRVVRQVTGSVGADAAWFVVQFPAAGTSAVVIGGDQSGRVYSMEDGVKNWEAALAVDAVQAGVSVQVRAWSNTSLPCGDDVIFAASRNLAPDIANNKVFAIRAGNGTVCWTFDKTTVGASDVDLVSGQPWVDYALNRLYVTSRAGSTGTQKSLWVINSLDGSHIASFALGHINGSPTLSNDGKTLYVGNEAGELIAIDLNPATPALKWSNRANVLGEINGFVWEDYTTPGRLYFTTKVPTLNVWCFQDPPGVSPTIPDPAPSCSGWTRQTVAGASTPLLLNKLYVGGGPSDGKLHEINLTGGGQDAQCTVGDGLKAVGDASSEAGAEVFVGTSDGKIFKFIVPLPAVCP